ncbi:extracellular solute-binding protein [Nonomuraea sp. NPDC049714]|uniref:extracellular solute-binding protein n=1 Tax=Nonomuraea sp. NPDC049714 TaxID=3364357 RepID=UPI0037945032
MRREVFDRWNSGDRPEKYPRVKLLELSDSTDLRRAQMAAVAQVGSCEYDVLVLDVAWVAEFARHGYIEPIELDDPGRFLTGPLKAAQIDGDQYGVPFAADALLEFRRLDQTDGGYLLQLNDKEISTINFLEMIEFGGGKALDGADRTDVVLGDDEDATWKALTTPEIVPFAGDARDGVPVLPASLQLDEDASTTAFEDGEIGDRPVSYMRNWPIAFHRLAAEPLMRRDDKHLLFEVAAPNRPGGVLGGSVLAISQHIQPKHRKPAKELIERLTSEPVQTRLFACGGYGPVLTKVYDDYQAGHGATCPDEGGSETTPVSEDELATLAAELRKSIDLARPRPKSPYYAQFSEAFRTCARGAWETRVARATFFSTAPGLLEAALNGRVPADSPPC